MYALNLILSGALMAGGTGACGQVNATDSTANDNGQVFQSHKTNGKGMGNKGHGKGTNVQQNMNGSGEWTAIQGEPSEDMTQDVLDMLIFLAQEEKVAKDLYTVIGAEYGVRPMQNISKSETQHQSAVIALLAKYGYSDPTTGLAVGEFEDPALQALYDDLLASATDYASAVEVGVAVEETDIADILEMLESDLPADVETVLNNLLKGSYNHLAAFSR